MNIDKNKMTSWCIVVLTAALISMFVLFAPANAGVSPEEGSYIYPGDSIIIGETNLSFFNATGVLISDGIILSNWENSHITIPFNGSFDSSRYEDELVPGDYIIAVVDIDDEGGITYLIESYIYFVSQKLDVTTEVCEEDFGWVTRGGDITFEANTNLWIITGPLPNNNISYKLLDPRGVRLYEVNDVSLSDIDVSLDDGINYQTINTAGMRTGVYTLSIETDPATNNGLDKEGPTVSFEVKSKGITVEAKPETKKQTVTKEIVFTVSTTPHTFIILNVTWGMASKVKFGEGGHSAFGWSDEDGKFIVGASFTDTGSYEITATEFIAGTTDSIAVEIVPFEATLTGPKEGVYHIGENIKITGSATAGDSITVKVDDEVVATGEPVEGFDYTWKTEDKSPGLYKIAIWVKPFSDPFHGLPDDSLSILLIRGGLFAKTSTDIVAIGDDFKIEGTVPGRDRVYILTIAPKGGSGSGFDPTDIFDETEEQLDAPGLTYSTSGVTDEKFTTEKIDVGVDADTGTYSIAVLNYGRDGVWGTSGNDNLLEVISNDYSTSLAVKTSDQILAILKDKTINVAGSDDLLGIATIKVENGFVTLDKIEDVPLGKNIEVTGITNRKLGTSIIVTVEGLEEDATKLKPKFSTVVEDDKILYNKFSISFATASSKIGKYVVTADDGDGHVVSTTVNILPATEPSVNVSISSTPTAENQGYGTNENANATLQMATPTPASTQTQTETKKTPGFETIFTFIVVFAVAWLMRSVMQRQ